MRPPGWQCGFWITLFEFDIAIFGENLRNISAPPFNNLPSHSRIRPHSTRGCETNGAAGRLRFQPPR
jgi:hypothetical protein